MRVSALFSLGLPLVLAALSTPLSVSATTRCELQLLWEADRYAPENTNRPERAWHSFCHLLFQKMAGEEYRINESMQLWHYVVERRSMCWGPGDKLQPADILGLGGGHEQQCKGKGDKVDFHVCQQVYTEEAETSSVCQGKTSTEWTKFPKKFDLRSVFEKRTLYKSEEQEGEKEKALLLDQTEEWM
uniref:Uncharacterized protein n=1 Tax=Chromera velia CCMP2878 TaxID=1169474 RepID=A0A0G4I255_9ALVE|eukprot:Cvel_10313.t1-p1 / transcript=Cvel_10313.t1 / gene=Cvel_10313 / organism=Chromera_velia_CCMP2878 / gene_product=hypothetical protein / transcript_product=hypothetical protein / location=Cvel_scaffold619:28433-28990(+) / protein_length=186 / sequence_SO=supercontig / SO=protein_coding / is_pseudo=false